MVDQKLRQRLVLLQAAAAKATTPAEKRKVQVLLQALEWELICADPWYFISRYCITHDPHSEDEPHRRFPDKDCYRLLIEQIHTSKRLLIDKSRQILASWSFVVYDLWYSITKPAMHCVWQSKKDVDADFQVQRAEGVYSRLPTWIQARVPATYSFGKLKFGNGSLIEGVPQGADQIRSRTPSRFTSDESAFQPEFAESFAAALPAIKGGQAAGLCVSSSFLGPFNDKVVDARKTGSMKVLIPSWNKPLNGMVRWTDTESGWDLLSVNYSADPDKHQDWAEEAAKEYGPKGRQEPRWRREMEQDPGAMAGTLIYPGFSEDTHVVDDFEVPDDWPMFVGIDSGYNSKCAVVFVRLSPDLEFFITHELYETQKDVIDIASMVKAIAGRNRWEFIMIGHDAAIRSQAAKGESISEQYAAEGLYTTPTKPDFTASSEKMRRLMKPAPNGEPRLKVFRSLRNWLWEVRDYRFKELSDHQAQVQNPNESPRKRDDHLMDATRYVLWSIPENGWNETPGFTPTDPAWRSKTIKQRAREQHGMAVTGSNDGYWD